MHFVLRYAIFVQTTFTNAQFCNHMLVYNYAEISVEYVPLRMEQFQMSVHASISRLPYDVSHCGTILIELFASSNVSECVNYSVII